MNKKNLMMTIYFQKLKKNNRTWKKLIKSMEEIFPWKQLLIINWKMKFKTLKNDTQSILIYNGNQLIKVLIFIVYVLRIIATCLKQP